MADLILSGVVGDEITAKQVQKHLANNSENILNVFINSVGGDVYEGLEIYNTLRASGKNITTVNTGMCASIASIIFLAGDERVAMEGTTFMVHKPSALVYGNADTMNDVSGRLDDIQNDIEQIYHNRTNMDDVAKQVNEETWLNVKKMSENGITNSDKQVKMMIGEDAVNIEEIKAELEAEKARNAKLEEDKLALKMKAELDRLKSTNDAEQQALQTESTSAVDKVKQPVDVAGTVEVVAKNDIPVFAQTMSKGIY